MDTLGNLPALHSTAASQQDHDQVGQLAAATQDATKQSVKIAYADQSYTGEKPAQAAHANDMELEAIKLNRLVR